MKSLLKEVKLFLVATLCFIGCCYLLGELQQWFISFIEGKELLLIIGTSIIMFSIFSILSIKSK